MHKSEDYSLEDLLKHPRIEEETRSREKRAKAIANVNDMQDRGKCKGRSKSGEPMKKWNLGETGHYAWECKQRKSGPSTTANAVIGIEELLANLNFDMIAESRALNQVNDGKQVTLANIRADVGGIRTVLLKFTSSKMVTLRNFLHVPTIKKFLASYRTLDENGFHISGEGAKIVFF
ncbi:hypothetical protein OSB04_025143 [Centaurea solstitialis]|uniref:Retrovirus-related Pol polyprotein from transposon TNT 1-94-like beta-barrel domain-containing protein n=1 Tax=Centaurea solstitialis TaxID=347529 RepID=A0AA38WEJ5_9ASTR|nr:hypothetical protein OSB04_025143 [Centaurea solstitialis]